MRKIVSFLKEARAELAKVVWPTRRRTLRLTVIVVIATIIFAAFVGAVDYGLSAGVEAVIDAAKEPPAAEAPPIDVQSTGGPVQIPEGAIPNPPAP